MITRKPDHLKAFDYRGLYRYFLTFCTYERREIFVTAARVDLVMLQILRAAGDCDMAVITYCFMPDHLHLLIEGQQDDSDALRFIHRAKQFSGFYSRKEFRERLWQRYGFERTLRDEHATLSVARYILENPVRAGIARNAADYPFSGSKVYSVEQILEAIQLRPGWYDRSG